MKNIPIANATHTKTSCILGYFSSVSPQVFYFLFLKEQMQPNPYVSCCAMIYCEYWMRSHQAPNSVHRSMQNNQWYQSPRLSDSPFADFPVCKKSHLVCWQCLYLSSTCHWAVWKGSIVWKWLFLHPASLSDFEVFCTLQKRNSVSAVPALISPKSFRSSALLEIKLITINDIEGWEPSLHGTPYSSIFHIKFKWKFSCWKGSNIFK